MARQVTVRDIGEQQWFSTIFVGNKSTIQLSNNHVFQDRSNHIEVCFHFINQSMEQGKIRIEHIMTKDQRVDILTKPLRVRLISF
jgi:hypothetical protein